MAFLEKLICYVVDKISPQLTPRVTTIVVFRWRVGQSSSARESTQSRKLPLLSPSIVLCTPWTRRTGFRIAPEETPVLQIPTMSGRFTHVTKAKFTTFFKNSLTSIGLDPTLFSVRSFRHGSIHMRRCWSRRIWDWCQFPFTTPRTPSWPTFRFPWTAITCSQLNQQFGF